MLPAVIVGVMPSLRFWVRYLLRPDFPGGIAAGVSLFMAARPDVVQGHQSSFVWLAIAFIVWWIPACIITGGRHERAVRLTLGQKVVRAGFNLYELMSKPNVLQYDDLRRPEYQDLLSSAATTYHWHNCLEIRDALDELTHHGIAFDPGLRSQADELDMSFTPNKAEDLAVMLIDLGSGLMRTRMAPEGPGPGPYGVSQVQVAVLEHSAEGRQEEIGANE